MKALLIVLSIIAFSLMSVASPLLLRVSVEADVVKLNGQVVAWPVRDPSKGGAFEEIHMEKIRLVLGRWNRSVWGHNNLGYLWDRLGVSTWEMRGEVSYMDGHGPAEGALYNIALQMQNPESLRDTDNRHNFQGDLLIDGIKITTETSVRKAQPALEKLGFKFDWQRHVAIRKRRSSSVTLGFGEKSPNSKFTIFIFNAL